MERKHRHVVGLGLCRLGACVSMLAILTNCFFDTSPSDSSLNTNGYSVSGSILDSLGTPVAGCNLILLEENQVFVKAPLPEATFLPRDFALTDVVGQFRFNNLQAKRYSLLARKSGSSAYQSLAMSDNSVQVTLNLKENGAFEGKIPVEFLERDAPVTAKIDEINLTASVAPDGSFRFDSIPEGLFHLALNLFHDSVDYVKSPLDIEIKSSNVSTLNDSLLMPWTARFKADFGDNELFSDGGSFGLLCADSIVGRTRCLQFEKAELSTGMELRCFPIGNQIPIDLVVFDSLGGKLGQGTTLWLNRKDSLFEIHIQ
jgi:hypothetical protein